MRTKTLLITAAIGVAAAVATQAQVYSVNAVGYINLQAKAGWNLMANQLIQADGQNTCEVLFAGVPGGTTVYKFNPASGYEINAYDADFEEWGIPGMTLEPGEGFWLRIGEDTTITLVGEVPQGSLSTGLTAGFNLVSSQVPQAGGVVADLGLPALPGGTVYTFDNAGGYSISAYDADFEEWDNGEPMVEVGEGFWYRVGEDTTWTRDFSVN
jgi:hypothetical protein